VLAAVGDVDDRPLAAPRRLVGDDLGAPALVDERLGLGGAGVAGDQDARVRLHGTRQQHLARVRVGRPRLGVQVVAVVPDRDEAEVAHGRVRRTARAEDDLHLAARDAQEVAVPRRRLVGGGEGDVDARPEGLGEHAVPALDVPHVRDAHDGPAARSDGGRDGLGDGALGLVPGQHVEDGPRRLPRAQRLDERGTVDVGVPRGVADRRRLGRRVARGASLGARVPRWDREAQHVGDGAGVAVGERAGERRHLGRQDRLGGDDLRDRCKAALVRAVVGELEHVAVDEAAGEAHLDPAARDDALGEVLGDRVVERAVQMRQRRVDEDSRDTPLCGTHFGQRPAAARSASARSVLSHGRPGRPKWP